MAQQLTEAVKDERKRIIARGRQLEHFTITWNCVESIVAIGSGLLAGSIALVGFGFDSLIESSSGAALLWRLRDGEKEAQIWLPRS